MSESKTAAPGVVLYHYVAWRNDKQLSHSLTASCQTRVENNKVINIAHTQGPWFIYIYMLNNAEQWAMEQSHIVGCGALVFPNRETCLVPRKDMSLNRNMIFYISLMKAAVVQLMMMKLPP